ncbi:unnamed protein product [Caenorhabditis bovis]|uniref:Uncharacterized protein n=1 Tax=Caenorhabditis bovis TaxID=2654633 RepID=A0A8S1EVH6_9PELO|nr:unnamed protein product [Caenorhabditis bovis]
MPNSAHPAFTISLPTDISNRINSNWHEIIFCSLIDRSTVLQLLCIDRYTVAQELFEEYIKASGSGDYPYKLPLLNFLNILLDVISTVNTSQFSVIVECYMNEISRDPTFRGYLNKIGKMYFNIREQNCAGGGGLAGLLQGLLGGETKNESATSHLKAVKSKTTPAPTQFKQPEPVQASRPTTASSTRSAMDVDDLD